MRVEKLSEERLEEFKAYCYKYRYIHDESFLYDEDIEKFEVNEENPTYLLIENNTIAGVLSLMFSDYYLAGKKSRVRIYHCEHTDMESYKSLLEAALPLKVEIDRIEMFIPEKLNQVQQVLHTIGFDKQRTSYVMVRKDKPLVNANFPEGYHLRPIRKNKDESAYAMVRNEAFKNISGSQTPVTSEMVSKQNEESSLLSDGMQILWFDEKAVGVLRMLKESEDTGDYSFVAPIALLPEYQGKGLGCELLKAGIELGQKNGLVNCMLVVNAENEQALSLYVKNGFEVDMAVNCLTLEV